MSDALPAAAGWSAASHDEVGLGGERVELFRDGRVASWREVLEGWCDDDTVRDLCTATLAASPLQAGFWETPPLTRGGLEEPFACVLLDAPVLEGRPPEPQVFAQAFAAAGGDDVASFINLGGDAVLVAPCPVADPAVYPHLLAFLRGAPCEQTRALWRAVGHAMVQRVGAAPVWLSTSGAGVAWLHVRLDDRPKYIQHEPYRRRAR